MKNKPTNPSPTTINLEPLPGEPRDSLHPMPGETGLAYRAFLVHLDAWCDLMLDLSRLGLHPKPDVIAMIKPLPPHLRELCVRFKWDDRFREWMGWFKGFLYAELNRGVDKPGFTWPTETINLADYRRSDHN